MWTTNNKSYIQDIWIVVSHALGSHKHEINIVKSGVPRIANHFNQLTSQTNNNMS